MGTTCLERRRVGRGDAGGVEEREREQRDVAVREDPVERSGGATYIVPGRCLRLKEDRGQRGGGRRRERKRRRVATDSPLELSRLAHHPRISNIADCPFQVEADPVGHIESISDGSNVSRRWIEPEESVEAAKE